MRSDIVKRKGAPFFAAMGRTPEEIEKPLVGVVNSQNELVPGHLHLNELATAVKHGIVSAGGAPFEFSTSPNAAGRARSLSAAATTTSAR
jgi:dihydroxy-acid dehydratase